MDFPVTAEFVDTANAAQLHREARGSSAEWPASFVQAEPKVWVYRVDDADEFVSSDPKTGEQVMDSRPRDGVTIDADLVKTALAEHVPTEDTPPTVDEKLAALGLTADDIAAAVDQARAG